MAKRGGLGQVNGLAAAVLMVLMLAACAAAPESAPESAPGSAPGSAPAPSALEAPEPAQQNEPEAAAPAPEIAALPPAPKIDDDPARLLGLDAAGLSELLGAPELVRREPPAQIWQYRGGSCVFDVFLYEEAGRHRVTYIEARDGAAQRIGERGCLNELLRTRLGLPLG